ncbi:MAG: shikimate kinase [Myxococcales bacterium]|nr:shikimate kinase [Myxococcales bacterium]
MISLVNNIALIGMPGAGKSTLGVLLAKRGTHGFLDVDLLIQESEGLSLPEIIETRGTEKFRHIEERCVLSLKCSNYVIATGGSVVYCERAMEYLKQISQIVYLDVPLPVLEERLGDLDARGVVYGPGQDLESLYTERCPLYERWADVRVECGNFSHDDAVERILGAVTRR